MWNMSDENFAEDIKQFNNLYENFDKYLDNPELY